MGPCPICSEPVALYNSKVIGLKKKLAGGAAGEKIQSLARVIMEYINSQAGPIDEERIERLIRDTESYVESAAEESSKPFCNLSPSVKNPIDSPITSEEVEDFFKIDINLLSKKDYFDKHFG